MENVIEITGIKCDNAQCDYRDDSVKFDEYPQWVNKPCPECGENLLTQENYDACLIYVGMLKTVMEDPEMMKLADMLDGSLTQEEANALAEQSVDMIAEALKGK